VVSGTSGQTKRRKEEGPKVGETNQKGKSAKPKRSKTFFTSESAKGRAAVELDRRKIEGMDLEKKTPPCKKKKRGEIRVFGASHLTDFRVKQNRGRGWFAKIKAQTRCFAPEKGERKNSARHPMINEKRRKDNANTSPEKLHLSGRRKEGCF